MSASVRAAGQRLMSVRTAPGIADMRPEDVPEVVAIEADIARERRDRPWSAALFIAELESEGRRYVTARSGVGRDRELLGYGGVVRVLDEAHITTVAVAPHVRRQGVATRVVLELMAAAIDFGATAATLEVRASNLAAQRLYARFGFAPVGVRPGYYAAAGEDAIIMWAYGITEDAYQTRLDLLGRSGSGHEGEGRR